VSFALSLVYESLWESMERDFSQQLDSDSFEGFLGNVKAWAGDHDSDAVDAVALEIWNTEHEDEPPEPINAGIATVSNPGQIRNLGTGQFAGLDAADYIAATAFADQSIDLAIAGALT